MDHVIFDVEIIRSIGEDGITWKDTDKLGVSVACLWEEQSRRLRIYGPDDVSALQKRLMQADRISGFNIFNFDFPVVWGIKKTDWLNPRGNMSLFKAELLIKTDDILRRIWRAEGLNPDVFVPATHGGWSLDRVARATLGNVGKIGNGAEAPIKFRAGNWSWVANYCADDVMLERDLVRFVDTFGYVISPSIGTKLHLGVYHD